MQRKRLAVFLTLVLVSISWCACAETVYFVDSTGRVEPVDTANPGVHAQSKAPTESYGKAGGITFNVTYVDVDTNTNLGFDDPTYGAERRARVAEVFAYFNTVLNHTGVCDVKFLASQTDGSGPLATGGTFFFSTPAFTNGLAFEHITTGVDPTSSIGDIETTFDFGWNWYQGTGTVPFSQIDFRSVALHELTHGLGILSLSDANGVSQISPNVLSVWDNFMETGNGKDLFGGAPPAFHGIVSDLVGGDGGLRLNAPKVIAAFGSKPPLYAPNPFQPGSSLGHWNTGVKIAGNAVMEPVLANGESVREYAPVDKAALEDIGYTLVVPVDPFHFTTLPAGGWFEEGQRIVLEVAVTGTTGAVTYQWTHGGADMAGATDTTYVIASATTLDSGWYTCRVTDEAKSVHETPQTLVTIVPVGSVPVAGLAGLGIAAMACAAAGLRALKRFNR